MAAKVHHGDAPAIEWTAGTTRKPRQAVEQKLAGLKIRKVAHGFIRRRNRAAA